MKRISFSETKEAFRAQVKDVTRRSAWQALEPGTELLAVEKAMGLRKGEKQVPMGTIRVIDVRREPLNRITLEDVRREGFLDLDVRQFVGFFQDTFSVPPYFILTRIEFEYLEPLPVVEKLTMPLGHYRDWQLDDVPAKYLLDLWEDGVRENCPLGQYIVANLDQLKTDLPDFLVRRRPEARR